MITKLVVCLVEYIRKCVLQQNLNVNWTLFYVWPLFTVFVSSTSRTMVALVVRLRAIKNFSFRLAQNTARKTRLLHFIDLLKTSFEHQTLPHFLAHLRRKLFNFTFPLTRPNQPPPYTDQYTPIFLSESSHT